MSVGFIKKAFTFLGVFFIVYCISLLSIGRSMKQSFGSQFYYPEGGAGHTQLRFQEAANQSKIDLLIIGSSHSYRNYDCRFFNDQGLKTFNLGSTAQTPIQTLDIMQSIGSGLSPRYVIIDFFLPLFYNEGIESSIDLLANTDFYDGHWSDHQDLKWYNAMLYHLMTKKIFNLTPKNCPETIANDQYISGGYVMSHQSFDPYHKVPKIENQINQKQLVAFATLISWLNEKKIKWMVIQSPILNAESVVEYGQLPYELQTLIPNTLFINAQSSVGDKSEYFIDADHLNQQGVHDFNTWIWERLKSIHFFS